MTSTTHTWHKTKKKKRREEKKNKKKSEKKKATWEDKKKRLRNRGFSDSNCTHLSGRGLQSLLKSALLLQNWGAYFVFGKKLSLDWDHTRKRGRWKTTPRRWSSLQAKLLLASLPFFFPLCTVAQIRNRKAKKKQKKAAPPLLYGKRKDANNVHLPRVGRADVLVGHVVLECRAQSWCNFTLRWSGKHSSIRTSRSAAKKKRIRKKTGVHENNDD